MAHTHKILKTYNNDSISFMNQRCVLQLCLQWTAFWHSNSYDFWICKG